MFLTKWLITLKLIVLHILKLYDMFKGIPDLSHCFLLVYVTPSH